MLYVFRMSMDTDILACGLATDWGTPDEDDDYTTLQANNANIANGATLVLIAHGNTDEIGGKIDPGFNASELVDLIDNNMASGKPKEIYIHACCANRHSLAYFAAKVALAAEQKNLWSGTEIYGHSVDIVSHEVPRPPPRLGNWTWIYIGVN